MEVHAKGEGEVEISVYLPLTHETLPIPDGKEGQFSMKILVVDDDPIQRKCSAAFWSTRDIGYCRCEW